MRLTKELRQRLQRVAKAAGHSFNAEVVSRLQRSFARVEADEILDEANAAVETALRYHEEALKLRDETFERFFKTGPIASPTKIGRIRRKKK